VANFPKILNIFKFLVNLNINFNQIYKILFHCGHLWWAAQSAKHSFTRAAFFAKQKVATGIASCAATTNIIQFSLDIIMIKKQPSRVVKMFIKN